MTANLRGISAFLILSASVAQAFPEMVRKGYTQCATCHVSPSGGGLLTDYGRALSQEALSHGTFFFEKAADKSAKPNEAEPGFLYSAVDLPSWLSLGGDLRLLQLVANTPTTVSGQFIPMQIDLEGQVRVGRFALLGTFGWRESFVPAQTVWDLLITRRHWLSVSLGPTADVDALRLRVGRFYPAFGVYDPDHTLVTRAGLGWGPDRETYNAELSWVFAGGQITATPILGRPGTGAGGLDPSFESGAALQAVAAIGQSSRVGLDGYTGLFPGAPASQRRWLFGSHAILGFSPRWVAWAQADALLTAGVLGGVGVVQLGFEPDQGVLVYVRQEYLNTAVAGGGGQVTAATTLGLNYYPRPHWEFLLGAQLARDPVTGTLVDMLFTGQLHYYL